MTSRFPKPTTKTIPLSNGDTITIRERLTHGEHTAQLARMATRDGDGKVHADPLKLGDATVLAYLLDWTFTDDAGQLVPIRGMPADELASVLNGLDQDSFKEIKAAIDAHEADLIAEKKIPTGGPVSDRTLQSVA